MLDTAPMRADILYTIHHSPITLSLSQPPPRSGKNVHGNCPIHNNQVAPAPSFCMEYRTPAAAVPPSVMAGMALCAARMLCPSFTAAPWLPLCIS
mmetsp:Transcript_15342/g.38208  ORF Transcript_15342/g.38208 Transcript_15342/m.38208 type:complete len:95 (-) Transcript_15342:84-368(-)